MVESITWWDPQRVMSKAIREVEKEISQEGNISGSGESK